MLCEGEGRLLFADTRTNSVKSQLQDPPFPLSSWLEKNLLRLELCGKARRPVAPKSHPGTIFGRIKCFMMSLWFSIVDFSNSIIHEKCEEAPVLVRRVAGMRKDDHLVFPRNTLFVIVILTSDVHLSCTAFNRGRDRDHFQKLVIMYSLAWLLASLPQTNDWQLASTKELYIYI